MPKGNLVPETLERLTYLQGQFRGKFMGSLDILRSDLWHEQFFDIEILSGEISTDKESIRPWVLLEQEDRPESELPILGLPELFPCQVHYPDGTSKFFSVQLEVVRFSKINLSHQLYEGQTIFGDIEAEISGFLVHHDPGVRLVAFPDFPPPPPEIESVEVPTGNRAVKGGSARSEFRRQDGSLFWSDWSPIQQDSGFTFWQALIMVISLLWVLSLVGTLLFFLWRPVLFIAIVVAILYLGSLPWKQVKWYKKLIRILGIVLLSLAGGVLVWFSIKEYRPQKRPRNTNSHSATSTSNHSQSTNSSSSSPVEPLPILASPSNSTVGDHDIQFHENDEVAPRLRTWNGFRGQHYVMLLPGKRPSEIALSFKVRNDFPNNVLSFQEYTQLVVRMYEWDRTQLNDFCETLNFLRLQYRLDDIGFAEMIISFVQSIPYTFLLPCDCNYPMIKTSPIIKSLRKGGPCKSFVKHGIISPVEFLGNLQGDCDTRVLFLFTILDHFGYDVVMLNSQEFQYSVLGVNLPIPGVSKIIDGRRYVICDLSSPGIIPGSFPMEFSDMNFWHTVLISNQIPL